MKKSLLLSVVACGLISSMAFAGQHTIVGGGQGPHSYTRAQAEKDFYQKLARFYMKNKKIHSVNLMGITELDENEKKYSFKAIVSTSDTRLFPEQIEVRLLSKFSGIEAYNCQDSKDSLKKSWSYRNFVNKHEPTLVAENCEKVSLKDEQYHGAYVYRETIVTPYPQEPFLDKLYEALAKLDR